MTPTPDTALAARLAELRTEATDEDLHEDGRYFMEYFNDLTRCGHGETGNFKNSHDGSMIAELWNAYRSGQLITLADHTAAVQAAVAKSVEAERAACGDIPAKMAKSFYRIAEHPEASDEKCEALAMLLDGIAAIRSRGL